MKARAIPKALVVAPLWNRLFWPSVLGVMSYVDECLAAFMAL
jgi:hypothetical protein